MDRRENIDSHGPPERHPMSTGGGLLNDVTNGQRFQDAGHESIVFSRSKMVET